MQDFQGKEIKIGDKVIFTVGTSLKSGIIESIKKHRTYDASVYKIRLDVPEPKSYWHWVDCPDEEIEANQGLTYKKIWVEKPPKTHRQVWGMESFRIAKVG